MNRRAAGLFRTLALSVALASLGACSAIRFGPENRDIDLDGAWVGSLDVDGRTIRARLDIRQGAEGLEAVLRVDDLGLRAEGGGRVDGNGRFTLDLVYAVTCPGTATMRGRWAGPDEPLSGTLSASDCTGPFAGDFIFRRR